MERLKPTNDFVFKRIFGEKKNSELLKDLLEAILPNIKIDKLDVRHQAALEKKIITNKLGILDIKATLNNGIIVNIEMQVRDNHNTIDRSIFYEAGIYHENLQKSEDYMQIPKTIGIWILNYDIFDEGHFHEIAKLKRDYKNKVLTDKFEIHYIQLPKFKKECKEITNKLEEWLTFISNENLEEIKMIENEYVKKAEEELEYLNADEEAREIARLREKAIRDEAAAIAGAKRESKIQIAKKMLKKKIDIADIIEITELTKEEIEKL